MINNEHTDETSRAIYELAAQVGEVARALRSLGTGDMGAKLNAFPLDAFTQSGSTYPAAPHGPMPEVERLRLRAIVDRLGCATAARQMHSIDSTISAALAGLDLRRETISHLLVGLESVERKP